MSSLDRVLGNDRIKEYMKKSSRLKRISHSYLIEGEKGSGKKMLARSFARILQCQDPGDLDCGACLSCRQIDAGNHPDVIYIHHEKPNTISVADIREQIVDTVDVIPYRGPYKIYIVDEAEKMNGEAQNALLKTLEEPPDYVVMLLLTTNRGSLLDTILSRCVLLQTTPVKREEIRLLLDRRRGESEDLGRLSAAELDFAAGFAMGNVGKALAAAGSEDFRKLREDTLGILRRLPEMTVEEMAASAKGISQDKSDTSIIFDIFLIWYRDLLVLKTTDQESRLIFKGEEYDLTRQSRQLSALGIDAMIREIARTRDRLRANVNKESSLLVLLVKMNREFQQGGHDHRDLL